VRNDLFTLEDLYQAYRACRRHKRGTLNALRFEAHLLDNLCDLRDELTGLSGVERCGFAGLGMSGMETQMSGMETRPTIAVRLGMAVGRDSNPDKDAPITNRCEMTGHGISGMETRPTVEEAVGRDSNPDNRETAANETSGMETRPTIAVRLGMAVGRDSNPDKDAPITNRCEMTGHGMSGMETRPTGWMDAPTVWGMETPHTSLNRSYNPTKSICFVQKRPKLREIFAADFRDRVVHHLLVGYLEPIFERRFIHDSYACRKGKGVHAAVDRLRTFLGSATANGSRRAWYLKEDISGFFMNIDKEILFELICRHVKREDVRGLAHVLIFHDCTRDYRFKGDPAILERIPPHKTLFKVPSGKGLPIGNLTSQFFANVYLNELDHFVKRQLRCRWYLRYCDDFLLLGRSPAELAEYHARIGEFLRKRLLLELNSKQHRLQPVSSGIDFLGYVVRRRYVLVRKRVVSHFREKLEAFDEQLGERKRGEVTAWHYPPRVMERFRSVVSSYLGHFGWANSHRLTASIFRRYPVLRAGFLLDGGKVVPRYLQRKGAVNIRQVYWWWVPPGWRFQCGSRSGFQSRQEPTGYGNRTRSGWTCRSGFQSRKPGDGGKRNVGHGNPNVGYGNPTYGVDGYTADVVHENPACPAGYADGTQAGRQSDRPAPVCPLWVRAATPQKVLVFFPVGSFYEFYDSQAECVCGLFGLKLTKGWRGFRVGCGFHRRWLGVFLRKALAAGYHVALIRRERSIDGGFRRRLLKLFRGASHQR